MHTPAVATSYGRPTSKGTGFWSFFILVALGHAYSRLCDRIAAMAGQAYKHAAYDAL